jgi:putative transposase
VLLRLAYLGVTNALALLRLLPMSDSAKDAEILALRHQITVLERQLRGQKIRFTGADRTFLAALLHRLPRDVLRRIQLLVRPETVLRWHRDLITRRHAAISRPKRVGRPPTVRSIRVLVLRLARENSSWGYRRIHGELLVLGIKVAASTVWEILHDAGIDPAPQRTSHTWAAFCTPKPRPSSRPTSSKPPRSAAPDCTSSRSSSTPPAGFVSSASPPTRQLPG